MTPRDIIDLAGLCVAGFVAWQNVNIRAALAEMKIELVDRIAAVEGDVKVLKSQAGSPRPRHAV